MTALFTNSPRTFAKNDVARVATRRVSHRGRNALIGLAIGGGAGAGVGAVVDAHIGSKGYVGFNLATVALGGAGALIGAAAGYFASGSGWHEIYRAP